MHNEFYFFSIFVMRINKYGESVSSFPNRGRRKFIVEGDGHILSRYNRILRA